MRTWQLLWVLLLASVPILAVVAWALAPQAGEMEAYERLLLGALGVGILAAVIQIVDEELQKR